MIPRSAIVVLTAIVTLSGSAVMADVARKKTDLLIRTIEQNGCKMTEETAEKFLPPLGFVQDETREIVADLQSKGLAAQDESGSLILLTENCR